MTAWINYGIEVFLGHVSSKMFKGESRSVVLSVNNIVILGLQLKIMNWTLCWFHKKSVVGPTIQST